MKVGSLVRIKSNEHLGLFVIMAYDDGIWTWVYSLSRGDSHNLRITTLEVINESR